MTGLESIAAAYAFVTVFVLIGGTVAHGTGDFKGNPLALFFWPLIAVSAVAIYIRDMWRK